MDKHMMRTFWLTLAGLALMALSASTLRAQVLTLAEDPTLTVTVTDLTGFQTTGQDMGGKMSVTAFFAGGASETVPWLATGVGTGAATGTGWRLLEGGDTWSPSPGADGRWELDVTEPNVLIDRLRLVGVAGTGVKTDGVVFDRTFNDLFGTPGSFRGRDFIIEAAVTATPWNLNVTYVDQIDSMADGPGALRDIWGQLDMDFVPPAVGGPGTFGVNDRLLFHQDTDTVGPRTDEPCTRPECPEPGGLLIGSFMAAMWLSRRRV